MWLQSSSRRWMTVHVADYWRKTVPCDHKPRRRVCRLWFVSLCCDDRNFTRPFTRSTENLPYNLMTLENPQGWGILAYSTQNYPTTLLTKSQVRHFLCCVMRCKLKIKHLLTRSKNGLSVKIVSPASVDWNSCRRMFSRCWRESVKPLQYYCQSLPLSYIVNKRLTSAFILAQNVN